MNIEVKEKLRKIIKESSHIAFLGGAGVSTASGIKDFRSPEGIYNCKSKYGVPYEVVLSHSFFLENPQIFFDFYWSSMVNEKAKPCKAHFALANYEKAGHRLSLITQNIDGLHYEAGSKEVYEVHGSVNRYKCSDCEREFTLSDIKVKEGIPKCPVCGGILKPDVVLYEEPLDEDMINGALTAISRADLLIIGGTSMNVYPVAAFPQYFRGKCKIIINKEATPYDNECDYVIHEDIGEVLEELLHE